MKDLYEHLGTGPNKPLLARGFASNVVNEMVPGVGEKTHVQLPVLLQSVWHP